MKDTFYRYLKWFKKCTKDDLLAAYQKMASDTQREKEALEWGNALIGDVNQLKVEQNSISSHDLK